MASVLKNVHTLEGFFLGRAFVVQRDLWIGRSVDEVSRQYGVDRPDVEAIALVHQRIKGNLPAGVRVSSKLPWVFTEEDMAKNEASEHFEKSLANLRNPKVVKRDWFKLPPAIHAGGLKIENAVRLLKILPDDAMRDRHVLVTAAPAEALEKPDKCRTHVARVLLHFEVDDIRLDSNIRAYGSGKEAYLVKFVKPGTSLNDDLAMLSLASGIVALTHYRALCQLHATLA